jgi:hypothetical protein
MQSGSAPANPLNNISIKSPRPIASPPDNATASHAVDIFVIDNRNDVVSPPPGSPYTERNLVSDADCHVDMPVKSSVVSQLNKRVADESFLTMTDSRDRTHRQDLIDIPAANEVINISFTFKPCSGNDCKYDCRLQRKKE